MNDMKLRTAAVTAPPERSLASMEHELWASLRREIAAAAVREEALRCSLEIAVLRHDSFASALAAMLGRKLADAVMSADRLESLALATMNETPDIVAAALADLIAIRTRDPAAEGYAEPFLYYKGFHALEWHRVGNALYRDGRRDIAAFLQSRVSEVFAIDIHPAVPVGTGVFIDHGTGIVVGETAVIGNDVSILQEVTLGGTGKERGDRHPKVRDGVLLSAGAKLRDGGRRSRQDRRLVPRDHAGPGDGSKPAEFRDLDRTRRLPIGRGEALHALPQRRDMTD
jgi:serine O-acetyltransferase